VLSESYVGAVGASRLAVVPNPGTSPRPMTQSRRSAGGNDPADRQRVFLRLLHDPRFEVLMTASGSWALR
jgi:hypothetical protein